jgi:hypothetical protein
MRSFRPTFSMILLGACLLCSCAGQTAKRKAAKQTSTADTDAAADARQAPRWQTRVGRVILVNSSLEFVLIDAGTSPAPEPGSRLRAYASEEPSAELAVSAHQQRPYLIADIVSGSPKVGDMVVPVKNTPVPDDGRRGAGIDRPPGAAATTSEPRAKEQPFPAPGGLSPRSREPEASQPQLLPQIERRPPPPPQSLLAPGRAPSEEAEAIIPGLPLPGKPPTR